MMNDDLGAAAGASEPALVASLPEPVPVSAHAGDGQAQGAWHHITAGDAASLCGVPYAFPHRFTDRPGEVTCVACLAVERAPFVREDRYIVIKHSDLTDAELDHIDAFGFRQREAVVVEADWPEYEPVWRMIEARVKGQSDPTAISLRTALEKLEKAALEVNRCGARTGPQWGPLARALIGARAALARGETA